MRLINVDTLELSSFTDDYEAPPYVILSHCWGDDEVTLQDVLTRPQHELKYKKGWTKIAHFCLRVKQDTYLTGNVKCSWVWVDTCCIDKTSSAELSEAINSMFRWYQKAICCFVWLPDVDGAYKDGKVTPLEDFDRSRWFTRGWTLQELLAPQHVYFYDKHWRLLGDKGGLSHRIHEITDIDLDALVYGTWEHCNIAQRMSWAADRMTTRREDLAYCLMGLFDVNMPLLYGEGDKAFLRLQEEIMKESNDQSILAWDATKRSEGNNRAAFPSTVGVLATHPSQFRGMGLIETLPSGGYPTVWTPHGLQITMSVVEQQLFTNDGEPYEVTLALLACRFMNDINSRVGIPVESEDGVLGKAVHFLRQPKPLIRAPFRHLTNDQRTIYLAKRGKVTNPLRENRWRCHLQYHSLGERFKMICAEPQECWTESPTSSCTMMLPTGQRSFITTTIAFSHKDYPSKAIFVVMNLEPNNEAGLFVGFASSESDEESTIRSRARALSEQLAQCKKGFRGVSKSLSLDDSGTITLRAAGSMLKTSMFQIVLSTYVTRLEAPVVAPPPTTSPVEPTPAPPKSHKSLEPGEDLLKSMKNWDMWL